MCCVVYCSPAQKGETLKQSEAEKSRKQNMAKMQWSLFLLILMGQCVFITCRLYRYHFVDDNKNWTEAQTYCREKYTDLATVFDMKDLEKLCEMNQDKAAWIGLYSEPNGTRPWRWSLPGVEFIEKQTKWDSGEPHNTSEELFVQIKKEERKWQDVSCAKTRHFICYDRNSSKKFHLIRKGKTWPEAQRDCREKHTDLVSGLKQLNNEELRKTISGATDQAELWIGLFRDTWKWSDGSSFSFRNWDHWSCPPEQHRSCAMIHDSQSLQWKNGGCDEEKNFFCYEDEVILIQLNKTWDEALEYCRQNHKDLVSITKRRDQRWVQDKAKNASSPFVWLGLRYTCTLGFWFWVSDETVSYKYWASDVENDDCDMSGAMERGGEYKWYKKNDADKFNFICSKF